ncbi:CBS domain-containing protein [Enterococcus columbae]|uniref:CBS domain-containing protein n=1 Tax=Enterococcus columbae DSM 7374 = ATCC 51263 TaxID=1121865 RepID=S0KWL0_9ENTE|nr:CBS domain-containing protein [Enterococcus columbae]EOT44503.1 hypothetical protein OMW_00559 [Enterococcus columbae DSM 7374 = ATCC 51263]EOW84661.1 hypothetical protein I568_01157 [Enterococcus columbae DSM 7374 = ATCC 51263]OJG23549.1 hypothetical protein RR47_GL000526 [Enterococcus columbae DSM 7374 = ATCC 51263]
MTNADTFLASFNRIEKWLRAKLDSPSSMGFSQMVRLVSKKGHVSVKKYEEDLYQFAQLRNAIVHDKVLPEFVIAEPNDWAVIRIQEIEQALIKPKTIGQLFSKKVVMFEKNTPLLELLKIAEKKKYSQFPLQHQGQLIGVITLRMLGYWFARYATQNQLLNLQNLTANDLLMADGKKSNYLLLDQAVSCDEAESLFHQQPTLEVIFITEVVSNNLSIVGIIRPRDFINIEEKSE